MSWLRSLVKEENEYDIAVTVAWFLGYFLVFPRDKAMGGSSSSSSATPYVTSEPEKCLMYGTDGGAGILVGFVDKDHPMPMALNNMLQHKTEFEALAFCGGMGSLRLQVYDVTTAPTNWHLKCETYGVPQDPELQLPLLIFCGCGRFCFPITTLTGEQKINDELLSTFKTAYHKHVFKDKEGLLSFLEKTINH